MTEAERYISNLQEMHPPAENWSALVDVLWDGLGERIPLFMTEMRSSGRIAVGAVSLDHPRIFVSYQQDRSYAVVIHEDLPHFIYRVLRACVASTSIGDDATGIRFAKSIDDPRLTQVIADIFWWLWTTGTVVGPTYPINDVQIRFAGVLAEETERFLLCHELAHVLVRPAGKAAPEDLIERLISGGYYGFLPEEANEWDEEFLADIIGVQIVMGITTGVMSSHGGQNQLRYAGVEAMLHIQHAMERLNFQVSDSHPPAKLRLQAVRNYIKSTCESDEMYRMLTMFGQMVEHLLGKAVDRILNPEEDRRRFQQEAENAIGEITATLDECAESSPGNYMQFYIKMDEILGRGYYHTVLEMLAKRIQSWRPADPKLSLALELAANQGRELGGENLRLLRDFKRFKLIVGYFLRQENPIGWYMMHVIDPEAHVG